MGRTHIHYMELFAQLACFVLVMEPEASVTLLIAGLVIAVKGALRMTLLGVIRMDF